MAKSKQLTTVINTQFFDYALSRQRLLEKTTDFDGNDKSAKINKECKRIFDAGLGTAFLPDDSRFFHIAFSDYYTFRRKEEQNALVYKVDNYHGEYTIETGLYCGVINFGDKLPQLEIQTGYSDLFFRRILNFCCGIYADTNVSSNSTESESIYSLLIQYLFLVSLRKVIGKAIPKKYVELRSRGYEIKGNIDVEEYIRSDLLSFDKKITYKYSKRLEIQSIIDVLYTALNCCQISSNECMPNLLAFREHIKNLYSGVRPSKAVVNNILKEKCLSNRLYADFIKPLEYARVLIKHNDLSAGGDSKTGGVSGFLVDSSFLWEMYLYNLMKLHLPEWEIDSQAEISFYSDTFYRKNNYPDFVLRHKRTGKIFVLDAKFKRMTYSGMDVDNDDIRQLHAYSYYFHLTEGDRFAGAGLIYPTKMDRPQGKNNVDNIYGVESTNNKFGVFSIKDPAEGESISGNEQKFVAELRRFLEDAS